MNIKLASALFTCTVIVNASVFAVLTDDIDADGIHGQQSSSSPSSSSTLPVTQALIERSESPDFEFVLQETLERGVLEKMRLEEDIKKFS